MGFFKQFCKPIKQNLLVYLTAEGKFKMATISYPPNSHCPSLPIGVSEAKAQELFKSGRYNVRIITESKLDKKFKWSKLKGYRN